MMNGLLDRVLISNFVSIVKSDATTLQNSILNPRLIWNNKLDRNKAILSTIRFLSIALGAFSSYKAIRALPIISSVRGAFKVALSVAGCVLSRDMFKIAHNNTIKFGALVVEDKAKEAIDNVLKDDQKASEEMAKELAHDTILEPLLVQHHAKWTKKDVTFFAIKA